MGEKTLRPLRAKQAKFKTIYMETGDVHQAFQGAGYISEVDGKPAKYLVQRAYQVLHKPSMQLAISKERADRDKTRYINELVTIDEQRARYRKISDIAMANKPKPDLANALRAEDSITKTIGGFKDSLSVTLEEQEQFNDVEKVELKRLADLLVTQSLGDTKLLESGDVIDAEVIKNPPTLR